MIKCIDNKYIYEQFVIYTILLKKNVQIRLYDKLSFIYQDLVIGSNYLDNIFIALFFCSIWP